MQKYARKHKFLFQKKRLEAQKKRQLERMENSQPNKTAADVSIFDLMSKMPAPPVKVAKITEEQKQRWLPAMASGDLIGAIAMTEPGAGSDLQGVKTTAGEFCG